MWIIFSILSAFFASLVAIFGKLGLERIDSTLATTIRAIIMAVFLFAISLVMKKFQGLSFETLDFKEWLFIILAGIAGALSWLFYFGAIKLGSASAVSALDRLSIVFVVFFAGIFLGEVLSLKSIFGVLFLLFGAVLISF